MKHDDREEESSMVEDQQNFSGTFQEHKHTSHPMTAKQI